MLVKTKAIVISVLKFQEKSLIVKCFTLSDGLKTYLVRNVFSSQKSKNIGTKIAYFQPLTLLEIEANHKNKGTLEHFKEVKLAIPFKTISTDIFKSTIAIFLSEVLHHAIKEEEKNENLFEYLETAFQWLDTHNKVSNFHLIMLLEMSKYLGFYPDVSNRDLPYFEKTEGIFSIEEGSSCFTQHQTYLFNKLINLKLEDTSLSFSSEERQIVLNLLLDYYSFHLDGFKKPKSLNVFKEVFS